MPSHNGWFGASGAVARPKVCANLEVYHPMAVEAPPSPSRRDVSCHLRTRLHRHKQSNY